MLEHHHNPNKPRHAVICCNQAQNTKSLIIRISRTCTHLSQQLLSVATARRSVINALRPQLYTLKSPKPTFYEPRGRHSGAQLSSQLVVNLSKTREPELRGFRARALGFVALNPSGFRARCQNAAGGRSKRDE